MRLAHLRILNFRSCRDVSLHFDRMHALVGSNNAGKSTVLRALEFLFNPSSRSLNEEAFWNKDTSREIRVEAHFEDLTSSESAALDTCLLADGTFLMARTAKYGATAGSDEEPSDQTDSKVSISQQYKQALPEPLWLRDNEITSKSVTEWWKNREALSISGVSFFDFLGSSTKPGVGEWKEKAHQFVAANKAAIPTSDTWVENPKGYANVLKAQLPFFVLVPAVRDISEESKGTKSSPFGKLLYAIINSVADNKKKKIGLILSELSKQMNRSGGSKRVPLIGETERQLNTLLGDLFTGCDLEIEFTTPTLEVLLSSPKLFVDDGFRNSIENKGHGLQRAVIFTILRRYAEHMTASPDGRTRRLFLAVEEPELYMHPQAQRTIRKVFRTVADGGDQIVFSTHSSLLVDVAYFDEIIRVEQQSELQSGKSTRFSAAWQLPMARMIQDIESRIPRLRGKVTSQSMRDLYSHAYNPRRSEGFFASKVILVEGATEEYSLPIYADALPQCSFDPLGISVVECGGKGPMDRLYRIFNELRIPCYVLFDYDTGNSDSNILDSSRALMALTGNDGNVPTATFVSDRVACFLHKWEADLRTEIPNADTLTAAARKELGLSNESGKPLIARYIARTITTQTPAVVPPTVAQIVKKAVQAKWQSSCLAADIAPGPLPTAGTGDSPVKEP